MRDGVPHPLDHLDLTDPDAVIDAFARGAHANRTAPCRRGSIDAISAPATLIATGDLHDNPLHLARLITAAGLSPSTNNDPQTDTTSGSSHSATPSLHHSVTSHSLPSHLTLHEIIHSDRLLNGMDFSHRALARVAALKAAHPTLVHTLLANHELAQIVGAGIVKDGVRVVEAFNDAVEYAFSDRAPAVLAAIADFIRSMPLALQCEPAAGGKAVLCAHSLPGPDLFDRFDPAILERDLTEDDYTPRRGSAHLMTWGRGHTPDLLAQLADRWNVSLFILGHEKAETGALLLPPNAIILNSDHDHGVYLPIDLANPPSPSEAVASVVPLNEPRV